MKSTNYEEKILGVISPLASGIITSLLYDAVSETSYIATYNNGQYIITSGETNELVTIAYIIGIFLGVWGLISLLIPKSLLLIRALAYDKGRPYKGKDLNRIIAVARDETMSLYERFIGDSCTHNIDFMLLQVRDLRDIITSLHRVFVPSSRKQKQQVRMYFRKKSISVIMYEFTALVNLLRTMVEQIEQVAPNDATLKSDCAKMNLHLDELEAIYKSNEHNM